jgi:hypothetical protein
MTFTYTFPCSLLVKVYMVWNFGTPKSPIMFNIVLKRLWIIFATTLCELMMRLTLWATFNQTSTY